MTTSSAKLRRNILGHRGLKPLKKSKKLVAIPDYPDDYPKTVKQKLLEYKYHIRMEELLLSGSLDDIVQRLHADVDRSTISKWRRKYKDYLYEKEIKEWI